MGVKNVVTPNHLGKPLDEDEERGYAKSREHSVREKMQHGYFSLF